MASLPLIFQFCFSRDILKPARRAVGSRLDLLDQRRAGGFEPIPLGPPSRCFWNLWLRAPWFLGKHLTGFPGPTPGPCEQNLGALLGISWQMARREKAGALPRVQLRKTWLEMARGQPAAHRQAGVVTAPAGAMGRGPATHRAGCSFGHWGLERAQT